MPPAAPSLVLDTVEKVRQLCRAVENQDNNDDEDAADAAAAAVVAACRALVEPSGGAAAVAATTVLPESLVTVVYQIYGQALLAQSQFERVLQITSSASRSTTSTSSNHSRSNVTLRDASLLQPLHMYALYRLERYDAAQSMARQAWQQQGQTDDKNKDLQQQQQPQQAAFVQHLLAQCQYRLGHVTAAMAAYETLLTAAEVEEENENETIEEAAIQVATNLVAAHVANATPFVCNDSTTTTTTSTISLHDARLRALYEDKDTEHYRSTSYDLLYNLATHDILTAATNVTAARQALQQAIQQAEHDNATAGSSSSSSETTARELALLRLQAAHWARVLWQGSSGGAAAAAAGPAIKHLTPSAKLVALTNRALEMAQPTDALRLVSSTMDTAKSLLLPLQSRLLIYNKAILQYKARQFDECMETCRLLQSSVNRNSSSSSSSSEKTKAATVMAAPPNSKMQALWWEARSTVLLVRAQLGKGGNKYNKTTAQATLKGLLQTLQKQATSNMRDHAVAYVQCHLAHVLQTDDDVDDTPQARIALLKSLPDSWQTKPAVVATLAALYQQQGASDKAMELVHATGHEDVLADLLLSQGQYTQAVALYQEADLTDPVAQARYARALTFCDTTTKAVDYWNQVRPADMLEQDLLANAVDGAELEMQTVPRLRTTTRTVDLATTAIDTNAITAATGAENNTKQKSHEAVLRRRARKREEYLAELDRRGLRRTARPDPERWLPKYERSYNRRRRQKGTHKGAQGGVSDKDAAQLDVAARQAARAAGEPASSTSTAHIAAVSSGGPRKGGRRR